MSLSFQQKLRQGQIGESLIARWLRRRGFFVLPVYEVSGLNKGPRLFNPQYVNDSQFIAPDMFVFKAADEREYTCWIEAKEKTTFSFYRKKRIWTTGVDKKYWEHYCRIQEETPWDVWLMFLHRGGNDKHTELKSEPGLFGEKLARLQSIIDHECGPEQMGNGGMVFWNKSDLRKLAPIEEIEINEMEAA